MAETPDVKQLLLTVDANAELLRTGLLKAARDVQAFQTTTDSALARVDDRFKRTGENTSRALQGITKSAGQVRNATQDLGYQISDLGTQISSGTDPMRAFSQQIGQVAFALSGMNGAVGQVGSFLAGPWGAALIFAAQVLGPFVAKLIQGGDAADEHAKKTAKLKTATEELDAVTGRATKTQEESIRIDVAKVRLLVEEELKTRKLIDAKIALQRAILKDTVTGDPAFTGFASGNQSQALSDLNAEKAANDKAIADNRASLGTAAYATALARTKAALDPVVKATQDYERELQRLKDASTAGTISGKALDAALTANEKRLQAVKDAVKEEGKSHRAAASDAKRHADELARLQAKTDAYLASLAAGVPGQKLNLSLPSPQELQRSLAQTNGEKAFDPLAGVIGQLDDSGKARFAQQQEAMKGIADEAERAQRAGDAFRSDLANGLADAIVSGKGLGDALVSAFKRAAAEAIASGIFKLLGNIGGGGGAGGFFASVFGSLGKREFGGPVSAGTPYIVGEKRPEVFVPSTPGRIIPNVPGGGGGAVGITINVDARGATDPGAVRQQARLAILEAAPSLNSGIKADTIKSLRRPGLPGGRG